MTVVRLAGDAARARLGAMVTIGLAGAGMAVVWPVVISSLGAAGARLSAVTMLSYSGSLVGPAVIGFVAARATLPVALLIPAALAVVVTAVAPAVLGVLNQPRLRRSS